jgi:uncharacterized protein
MKEATADVRLQTLEQRHRILDDQVRKLERRAFLTPTEQRHVSELKKQKLMAKDELYALKREL